MGRVVALVPAFRRADRVGATVVGVLPLVDRVVVVDDGSCDGGATAAAAREAGATVVVLPANRGKGGALTAGVAATPDADTYLLVDADTAETAAATAPLLQRVGRGADLSIGVLPPAGGRGGFGTVRHLAEWGIRRACGFEAAAPLSGQRAVRGPLLRSLELADRFGVEVGMTIDAVRAGAQVVEVPVSVDHAHTGRGVAGFSHRAGQGWDLLRALWPRLLPERSRLRMLVGAALVLVGVLAATGAAAVPTGTALGPADRVVLVAAPPVLRLDDLDDPSRPELASLSGQRGAVAAANVDVPERSEWSSWATVGAGAEVRSGPPTKPPDPKRPFLVQDIEDGQGRLGAALHGAGLTTAFVGHEPTSPVRLAVADRDGEIDRASTASSLGVGGMLNRTRGDLAAGVALVAVDASGLDPDELEALLAGLRNDDSRQLLLLVTPADPGGAFGLRPLVASGPGAPAGRLVSPSTRRDGLVLLTDVAPTVLASLGVPTPEDMIGHPLRRLDRPADVGRLVDADRQARESRLVWMPAVLVVALLHFVVYAFAWRHHRRFNHDVLARPPTGPEARLLTWLACGLVSWPLAGWLVRIQPDLASLGRWVPLVAAFIDALLVAVASWLGRRRHLAPVAILLGATVAFVTVDLASGSAVQLSSAFGATAGRFTGLGNATFAVYAASALAALACAHRRAPWMVALLVLVALVNALPTLGGDVGGALTVAPVFTLTIAALWDRLRLRTAVLAGAATVGILGIALALDFTRPPDARTHLARFVTSGGSSSSIAGKVEQNLSIYTDQPLLIPVVGGTIGWALLMWRGRFRRGLPPGSPARIAVAGGLALALLGNLLNDFGPIVTLFAMGVVCPTIVVRSLAAEEPPPTILPRRAVPATGPS